MLLDQAAVIFGIILKVASLYMLVMCLFFIKKAKPKKAFSPNQKFACLIAARNEEAVIGNLIKSLKCQDYPSELIEIYAIPNNCTDNTADAARRAGAEVIRPKGNIRNKGDALHYAIRQLLPRRDIDCFIIFDADNIAAPDFIKAMNDAFMNGAQITKSRIEAKNPYDSWVSGCYGLYYNIFNKFFNESRSRLDLAPKLIGTGMGIRRDVLLELGGWNTLTIAEDTEFNADCVLDHYRIRWVPDAVTYDEAPESFRTSLKQRKRWVAGIMEVAHERLSDLMFEMRKGYNLHQLIDMSMILILPYLQVFSLIPGLMLIISGILSGSFKWVLLTLSVSFAASYLGTAAFALLLAKLSPYNTSSMRNAILLFPVFTLSWIPICIGAFFTGAGWEPIRHTHSISFNELDYMKESAA